MAFFWFFVLFQVLSDTFIRSPIGLNLVKIVLLKWGR